MTNYMPGETITASTLAADVTERAWQGVASSLFVEELRDAPLEQMPRLTPDVAERAATQGREILDRAKAIDHSAIDHNQQLDVKLAEFAATQWLGGPDRYWLAFDPDGLCASMFPVTAYGFGNMLHMVNERLGRVQIQNRRDADHYLDLLEQYGQMIDDAVTRLTGQADRGFLLPRPMIPQARVMLDRFIEGCGTVLTAAVKQAGPAAAAAGLTERVERLFARSVLPKLVQLRDILSDDYAARAPEVVGLSQYSGGEAAYRALVQMHTSMPISPEQAHASGLERMQQIMADMRAIRETLGFEADPARFHHHLRTEPPYGGASLAEIQARFDDCQARIAARLGDLTNFVPQATHSAERLDPKLEGSMTFGFYAPPSPERRHGTYFYNGRCMQENGSLATVPSLLFHELVPGHHFHFSMLMDLPDLHPLRRYIFVNAFNESWAEYSATLVGEIGLYLDPYERYGRLLMDAFLTSRLVVDTGMNLFGWSLERARAYMRAHTFLSEVEIQSETLRYSCDIPAQALAYKLGDTVILTTRERARQRLGNRFDLRQFNDWVIGYGTMPLPVLEWHVDRMVDRELA